MGLAAFCRGDKILGIMLEMEEEQQEQTSFSLAETRHIVRDLFAPNPWIYWADFLVSLVVGVICFGLVRRAPTWLPGPNGIILEIFLFLVSSLLYYRAALFIHEIVHFRSGSFRVFRVVWNLLCGIPFLLPSFTYYTHLDHHRRKHFGTKQDGEYLPLGHQSTWAIWFYLSQSLIIPGLAVVRFMLLTPLTWVFPGVRRWVHQRASSLVMDPSYVRPLPARDVLRVWRTQELASCLFCWAVAVLLIRGMLPGANPTAPFPVLRGVLPLGFLAQVYLTGVVVVLINSIRTLGAHRFFNDGREMTFVEQLLDSVNYPRRPILTGLWAPVGLRFHALHHLFPSLPYHNLAEAHRRLMAELPADSPYRATEESSLWSALRRLWRLARKPGERPVMPTA
jgi:fatty acid desaturase